MPFGLGIWEIVILVGVLVLLFGAKGVPDVARRLGGSIREVQDAVAEIDPRRMLEAGDPEPPKPSSKPKPKPKPAQTAAPERRDEPPAS